jgi:hypothetical protein
MRFNFFTVVYYIPIVTTLFSLVFAALIYRRYRLKGKGAHLLWWCAGVFIYGIGTFTESYVSLFGWNEPVFRAWYISGALLGGAPLAQGTIYLLMKRKTANRLTGVLVPFILIAATFVILTPLNHSLVEVHRLSGTVIEWQWVRLFSPFINTYAFIFLVGGAVFSAYRFRKSPVTYHRYIGNIYIAIGALLPGIGGSFTRFGYTEVLYITEFLGIILISIGFRYATKAKPVSSQHKVDLHEIVA